MGLTFFYSGKAKGEKEIKKISQIAKKYAKQHNWTSHDIDLPTATGLVIEPHPDVENITLLFKKDLYLDNYTKTQFGGAQLHQDVVELFKKIEPFFEKLSIVDESDYWKTGDLGALKENIAFTDSVVKEYKQENPKGTIALRLDNGRIADFVG